MLEVASVLGREFGLEHLVMVTGAEREVVADRLHQAAGETSSHRSRARPTASGSRTPPFATRSTRTWPRGVGSSCIGGRARRSRSYTRTGSSPTSPS